MDNYRRVLQILAVLYVKNQLLMYCDYMAGAKAFAEWLLPEDTGDRIQSAGDGKFHFCCAFDGYTVQQLSKIWKINVDETVDLLTWAQREVERHDPSNPQATLPF